jgi:hypothetical protein
VWRAIASPTDVGRATPPKAVWRSIDLIVRFIYVLIAPLALVICAAIFPITATLISTALATVIAMFGADRWRARVAGIPFVGRALGKMSRLGEYYAVHPAKPLVYYIFYPVLLPVILFLRGPRREFLLYRRLGTVAIAILVATNAWDYLAHWRPELPFSLFFNVMVAGLILQLLATFALVMPIVTTFVELHRRHRRKTLWVLFAGTVVSATFAMIAPHKVHQMQIGTWIRIESRVVFAVRQYRDCIAVQDKKTCGRDNDGLETLAHALDRAYGQNTQDAAVDAAHDALEQFFKPDEAAEFRYATDGEVAALFVRFGNKPALWLARDKTHRISDGTKLPPSLRKLLGL